jgi:aminoglycoside phosphotransferase (APT) family kinase protein
MPTLQTMADDTAPLTAALAALMQGEVTGLARLTGGASRETWSATVRTASGDRRVILQRTSTPSGMSSQGVDMAGEAALVRAAHAAGVPTAEVLAASGDPDLPADAGALGTSWALCDHVDGETIARRILRDDRYATARTRVVDQAADALARIHRLPTETAPQQTITDPVARFRSALDLFGEPHAALELGLRWLDQHRPGEVGPCVVHGDFRLGNWIVDDDGLAAVVDWELAHLGDPGEDLGWMCVRAWRFGGAGAAAGLGSHEQLLDSYLAAGGLPLTLDDLRWWEAYGTLAWGVMCIAQASRHRSGYVRSVELAAIGRRVCENEHDLLALLPGPALTDLPAPAATVGHPEAPHDVPSAVELLDAVAGFLRDDVMGATSGRVQFHTRVAANVVDQVRRQIEMGSSQAAAHRDRLAALGFADDGALAAAIRAGELDDRFDEVKAAVWASVRDKLAVAHPDYERI